MIANEIGIVVIGRNEGSRLMDCLKSVKSVENFTVYVDSGSTDGSAQAAERLGAYVVLLDPSQPFTAARARNEGFTVLRKLRPGIHLVQFIDGDCELDENWLSTAVDFIKKRTDTAIVCGRRRERHRSASIYNALCDMEWNTPVGQAASCGGDSLVRATAFEAVGGFRRQLIAGEEPELCFRLRQAGWLIWRLDAEMTRHDAAITRFGQWWVRAVRSGYGTTELALLYWRSPLASHWKKQLISAVLWSFLIPSIIALGSLWSLSVLYAVLLYPLQICRIALSRTGPSFESWSYACFIIVAKFAEFQGILKFFWRTFHRKSVELIEYK
jgi:GT2 family glycosyltransferase